MNPLSDITRQIRLIELLRSRHVDRNEAARHLGVSARTISNDLEWLASVNVPVRGVQSSPTSPKIWSIAGRFNWRVWLVAQMKKQIGEHDAKS